MSVRSRKKTHEQHTYYFHLYFTICYFLLASHAERAWLQILSMKSNIYYFCTFQFSFFLSLSFFHDHPPKKTYRVSMPNSVPKTVYISSFLFYYFFIFLQFFRTMYIILLFVICVIVYQIQKTSTTTTPTAKFEACTNGIYGRKWSDGCLCVSAFRMFVSVHTLMLAVLESEIEPNERREKVSNSTKHSTETL